MGEHVGRTFRLEMLQKTMFCEVKHLENMGRGTRELGRREAIRGTIVKQQGGTIVKT